MDLSAYTIASVQTAAGIIRVAKERGLSIDQTDKYLDAYVDEHTVLGHVLVLRGQPTPCPTDGCPGHLEPWPKSSREAGVPIVGCLLCRYSMIDWGANE